MRHSKNFEKVNKFYNTIKPDGSRMWSKQMVKNAVIKEWITVKEYKDITDEEYSYNDNQ